ncbi:uncharacterized protein K452DRAFT_279491 [Aplosporella prunicola CBS 121167]|uniref:K Homology domain-containing protein n=1 Tax=Aplosporella prunicola CBS 121167 TaxID=1176127 RepID=A0A6A6B0N6_9PEZI|nr:uncharacterized protein K452DRAFT_279491 [Aplosporella prunicola CBS 121167]KAF2136784.1 hypothetical protein K452DRAFT_279491 [Aplosporella prunicola CBS 121167]
MHKISNFTGQARHGWEKMTPSMGFGMSRSHNDLPNQPVKRPSNAAAVTPTIQPGTFVNLSFNVPFASNLGGPDAEDVVYASPGAFARWTRQDETPEAALPPPTHTLPVHVANVENLRSLCKQLSATSNGTLDATVVSSEPKPLPGLQRVTTLVTNVCLSGEADLVRSIRCKILNETPIALRCTTVDLDYNMVFEKDQAKSQVLTHIDEIAKVTKADIFLLQPKPIDIESASINGTLHDTEQRLRCAIYGDVESAEFAKTRILIMIDQILHRHVDTMKLELTMHTLICGRARKNIKLIESATNTAIYFPPPFPRLYGYTPPGALRRPEDEIIITGEKPDDILQAKHRLHDLVLSTRAFMKEVIVTTSKIDNILLERLDKVRKIIENNGSYILLPPLGFQRGPIRVQGTDVLNVERTIRELMALAGQFYSASWCITHADPSQRPPTPDDVRAMLSDICINSGAEISFERLNFHISGSDDAVKAAMMVINNIPFVRKSQYNMSVKIELANEHKEFVSGKKNGKINKIMSQSNVQIVFDGFNEYNFYIVVRGARYEDTKGGLDLVEQEMPAAISFHVPDQYHKRIIGIGGQHIQRIMKKYSVFVKFSNAMDRGGLGKEEDDIKVDNVICRTPARNAQNLDLVKQEIMDMVEKVDAEFVSEHVVINRLYHRELISRMNEIEELEKKWNCKIVFPSTEQASDVVTVSGPEYQVPQAVDEFLSMVPETHEMSFLAPKELSDFLRSDEFRKDVLMKMKAQYNIEVHLNESQTSETPERMIENLVMSYTRNYAGGLKDAIDYFIARLVAHGLDVTQIIKGAIPRPKSDSFEDSLPFFASRVLQPAEPRFDSTDSPTRSVFGDDTGSERMGFLDRLRKPGSMSSFSSFIERRKNGSNSPGSLFTHASRNASKASLVSLESQSSYRNPWNDSGINLPDEEHHTNGWPVPSAVGFHHSNSSKLSFHGTPTSAAPGDMTPRYDPRASVDSGRPSTSHSASGYPAPIGPPR